MNKQFLPFFYILGILSFQSIIPHAKSSPSKSGKALPVLVNGKVDGFKLDQIKKGSIYEKLGFQNGDVIKEVNGAPLNGAKEAIKHLIQLKNANSFEIKFLRKGKLEKLVIGTTDTKVQ